MKQLRITTTAPHSMFSNPGQPLVLPDDLEEAIERELIGDRAYFHGELETLAGFDIPVILDGDMAQMDLPVEEQDILALLPSGSYQCIAELQVGEIDGGAYYITLKP